MRNRNPRVVKYARSGRHRRMVDAIKAGEPVNSVDSERRSALFHAALRGNKKCLKELLRRGGDPNQRYRLCSNRCSRNGLTPCHAAALGGSSPRFPCDQLASTRNPLRGAWLLTKGTYTLVFYYAWDRRKYRQCLEYLTEYGGDPGVRSLNRETVRDIAIRMRKMSIVEFIEEFYSLQTTPSGYSIKKGHSMLRPTASYPRSCPRWMHSAVDSGGSLDKISPLTSQTSIFHGRTRNAFDYGFVYPFGGRVSPGANNSVPEVMPSQVYRSPKHYCIAGDGSMFGRGLWQQMSVTIRTLRCQEGLMTVEQMLKEMDGLALLRHPGFPLLMAVSCGPARSNLFAVLEPLHWAPLHHMLYSQGAAMSSHDLSKLRWDILHGIANALQYLHTIQQAVHCLVSSHSVLLTSNGKPKLINLFCLTAEGEPIGKLVPFRLFIPWMAPELLLTQIPHFCCDVYSLGVLVWEMWTGEEPWAGITLPEVYRLVVQSGKRLHLSEHHRDMTALVRRCFQPSESRPAIDKVVKELSRGRFLPSAVSDMSPSSG